MTVPAPQPRGSLRAAGTVLAIATSSALSAGFAGTAIARLAPSDMAPWLLGRASGLCAYLLIWGLVAYGLWLAHPWSARPGGRRRVAHLRIHVSLAAFTLAFTVLHVVALATDPFAHVGWRGALLPGFSAYRPFAVSLGILGLYAGMSAGVTAAAAGRFARRLWWPVHKVAATAFVLVWTHGVLAGTDAPLLLVGYLVTGGAVFALAVSRYLASDARGRAA